jgi:SAM-dependent methyltransferase
MSSPDPVERSTTDLREAVRARYAAAAAAVSQPASVGADDVLPVLGTVECCDSPSSSTSCCATADKSLVTRDLYRVDEVAELPSAAVLASLGCGNPTALAQLRPGEVVLDLGSGGGIDVLLSARRVGRNGFAYGLDMTDEMLALARRNAVEADVQNVRFLKGEIEHIPLPDRSVDVVISNCVINLSADKGQVLREAFRVLKLGGRFAVSDVVVQGELPTAIRTSLEQWVGCIAGALEEATYRRLLTDAGFVDVGVEVTRVYDAHEAGAPGPEAEAFAAVEATGGRLVSAFVRALRPDEEADTSVSEDTSSVSIANLADMTRSAGCCSRDEQASCCAPEQKSSCCGSLTSASPGNCGCR